ncbi:MAG: ATP-binding protein [Thermoanaerobaculia bacterium]|nr:ATP-binding protein [Thermoanaerobaculia bacterium]
MKPRLGTLLVLSNAVLVLLAVAAVAVAALALLERLADEQALARVALGAESARQTLERSADEVATSARLLAERPTVARLTVEGRRTELGSFLERFRETSHLTACAIESNTEVLAASGAQAPGPALGAGFGRLPDGRLALFGRAPLATVPGVTAATVLGLDAAFVDRLSRLTGLAVTLIPPDGSVLGSPGQRTLRLEATTNRRLATGRAGDEYRAVLPVGEGWALLEVALPRAGVAESLADLRATLLLLAVLVALAVAASGFVVGHRLAGPLRALTTAARRIGTGDLEGALPMPGGALPSAEVTTLAVTMEDMRRRLAGVTEELRRRQAEAEAVLTGIAEGVFAVDGERRIQYLNPQAAALLGIDAAAAVGRFCGDVLQPRGLDGVRPCEDHCPIVHARFRGTARAAEHLTRPDGTRRTVVVTSSEPAAGRQFQILRDETEVEATRRLRDAVLANVSHEFRTPLAAQLASLELLRDRLVELEAEDALELVQSLENGALRLTQLIDNLLEGARIEAGQDSIRRRPVALDEVVERAVELTAPLLARRRQELAIELPYPLPAVSGDAPRLTQVLVNLLGNANKFAPEGTIIRIGGRVEDEGVTLWVDDQGPGLPPGAEGALFARFARAPAGGEEPQEGGVGLGLWIVQSIVERHGGRVEVGSSELSGAGGARLGFTLPRGES